MKCAKCHIHYDDAERECPMCGTRKPLMSSQAVRPTPAKPVSSSAAGPVSRGNAKPETARLAKASIPRPEKPTRASKKKGKASPILIIIIIFILLQLIPALLAGMTSLLSHNTYEYEAYISPQSVYPEPDDADYAPVFPQSGLWMSDALQIAISATPDEEYGIPRYAVRQGTLFEAGYYHTYPCTPEDGWEFPAEFPAQDFAWWAVNLYPTEWRAEGALAEIYDAPEGYGELGSSLSIFVPHESPVEAYFVSDYLPIPWLAYGTLLRMDYAGSAADADALIAQLDSADTA